MLMRRQHVRIAYLIFDVLSLDGRSLMSQPYIERRRQLEALDLNGIYWRTPETFDDGAALFEAVCERGLEGRRRETRRRPLLAPVSAAGSRSRTARTGAATWSVRAR